MTTKTKSFLVLVAAATAVANLSCARRLPQTPPSAGRIESPEYRAPARVDAKPTGELPDTPSSPAEKISQTVFPIPDILCVGSPIADERTASHLEEAVIGALNDLVKPGQAKVNTLGGPVVRVHADPGIIVFSGTWEQTELVRNTLKALKDTAQERASITREREKSAAGKE